MLTPNIVIDDEIFSVLNPDSVTALSKAAIQGDLDKIKKLILKGSLPQNPDNRGWTAIHYCVAQNQLKALELILKLKSKNKKYLVNLATWEQITPLLIALKSPSPSLEMVQLLLKSGASAKAHTYTNLSPIHLACLNKGNLSFVKLLVQAGADVNIQDCFSTFTPLHFAISEAKDLEIIRYLIDKCDLTIEDKYYRTPFLEACKSGFVEAVKLFLEKDRNFAISKSVLPPLVYAAAWGNLEMTKMLIECGAEVNSKCRAIVPCKISEPPFRFLGLGYLPIYSALKNLEVFKLFLELTNPEEILEISTSFRSFPVHVLLFAEDISFFELLLQSNLPGDLKKLSCSVLINFILGFPSMKETFLQKFNLFFKYNFYLDPEDVFQNFVCLMPEEELLNNHQFLNILAQMGISSEDDYSYKKNVIGLLASAMDTDLENSEAMQLTCTLLSQPVLSLKKLSRIIVRRSIKLKVLDDWLVIKMIEQCNYLPDSLKKFLFFESY